jgi:hypothetical protein
MRTSKGHFYKTTPCTLISKGHRFYGRKPYIVLSPWTGIRKTGRLFNLESILYVRFSNLFRSGKVATAAKSKKDIDENLWSANRSGEPLTLTMIFPSMETINERIRFFPVLPDVHQCFQ